MNNQMANEYRQQLHINSIVFMHCSDAVKQTCFTHQTLNIPLRNLVSAVGISSALPVWSSGVTLVAKETPNSGSDKVTKVTLGLLACLWVFIQICACAAV